jgi:hypothetical protein
VIADIWRAMSNKNVTYLFPIIKIALKPPLKAKEIREELAVNFLSGRNMD